MPCPYNPDPEVYQKCADKMYGRPDAEITILPEKIFHIGEGPDTPFWMGLLNPIIEFFQSIFV